MRINLNVEIEMNTELRDAYLVWLAANVDDSREINRVERGGKPNNYLFTMFLKTINGFIYILKPIV